MKEDIAYAGIKTMLSQIAMARSAHATDFGVETETGQRHDPADTSPDDRERVATLQGDRHALFRDR